VIPDTYYLISPSILVSRPPSTVTRLPSLVSRLPSPVSRLPIRPNTTLFYTLFTSHSYPIPAGQLKYKGWKKLIKEYPDNSVTEAILGICQFGARIGFEGVSLSITIHPNLSSAFEYPDVVTAEIEAEVKKNRLRKYCSYNTLPGYFIASPLVGLTDKSDGTKRRIHHLSYPPNDANSINSGIPELYGSISYSSITEAISAIQQFGNSCSLVKRDFESAFRHIPVSPLDTPLLGLYWQNTYYAEQYLPFRLRTAPYIFNLFAETFHWILADELQRMALPAKIVHYLDDFLIILPPATTTDLNIYTTRFSELCQEVGLSIKESKNEEGTIAIFGGIEMDTENMVIRLPETSAKIIPCVLYVPCV